MKPVVFGAVAALLATSVFAAPLAVAPITSLVEKRDVTDIDILQFALTAEFLENAFYKEFLSQVSQAKFVEAGFSVEEYINILFIAEDEQTHVTSIQAAITAAGATPVQSCKYNFGINSVHSFFKLSAVIENVGSSAYLGAAPLLQSKDVLSVAASIMVVEAGHTSLQRENIGLIGVANPFGTPLGLNAVFTILSTLIVSCPSTNAALPVQAFSLLFPSQTIAAVAGLAFEFTVVETISVETVFLTFVSGLLVVSVPAEVSQTVIRASIPSGVEGQTYVFLSNTNATGSIQDADILNGPAIIEVAPQSLDIDFSII